MTQHQQLKSTGGVVWFLGWLAGTGRRASHGNCVCSHGQWDREVCLPAEEADPPILLSRRKQQGNQVGTNWNSPLDERPYLCLFPDSTLTRRWFSLQEIIPAWPFTSDIAQEDILGLSENSVSADSTPLPTSLLLCMYSEWQQSSCCCP